MDYRADWQTINSYIEECTARDIEAGMFIDKVVELNVVENMHVLKSTIQELIEKYPVDYRLVEDTTVPDWRSICDAYIRDGEDDYDYSSYRHVARNLFLFCGGGKRTFSDYDARHPHRTRLRAEIVQDGALYGIKVWAYQSALSTDFETAEPTWQVKPVKLSKFLRKIGVHERFVTLVAGKVSNKPRAFRLMSTDMYIPEAYMEMRHRSLCDSCMAKPSEYYDLPDDEHPTLVYENLEDVRLVLIKDMASDSDFPYVTRAIVRIKSGQPIYSTTYGLEIIDGLEEFGVNGGDMTGIRLAHIESRFGGTLAPYVDGTSCCVDIEGSYIVYHCCGEYETDYETGRLKISHYCDCCGDSMGRDEATYTVDEVMVCSYCLDRHYVYLRSKGDYYPIDHEDVVTVDGDYYHNDDVYYSEFHQEYILEHSAKWSERCDSYIFDHEDELDLIPFGDHPDDEVEEDM